MHNPATSGNEKGWQFFYEAGTMSQTIAAAGSEPRFQNQWTVSLSSKMPSGSDAAKSISPLVDRI